MDKPISKIQDPTSNFPPAGAEPLWAAPVVSVLGHVDHGKTSLLDKIRSSGVAAREKGGITQRIGASEIEVKHEGKVRRITFIDTPGHEAFANMRSQGVNAADIVLLIVAADDGVMPQTRESIAKIQESKLPFIVVFTKIDLETANIEKVKQQIVKEGIMLEGLGGDVPFIGVSSKTGEHITELLDLIILLHDLSGQKKDDKGLFEGVVIDTKQDKRRGTSSSIVVKTGKIEVGKELFTHGRKVGKVRALIATDGKNVSEATPGTAVEILGFLEALPPGAVLFDREVEAAVVPESTPATRAPLDLAAFLAEEKSDVVPIILKTETTAEMEAIKNALPKNVKIIFEGQGDIVVSDVLMAKDFHALVIGFNASANPEARALADSEKIFYKSYSIIYEMLDEIEQLITSLQIQEQERILGRAQILASFLGSSGPIIGLKVIEGRLATGDRVRVMRGERELGTSTIASIKHGKEDARVTEKGKEYGITLADSVDFAPQDVIIAYSKKV